MFHTEPHFALLSQLVLVAHGAFDSWTAASGWCAGLVDTLLHGRTPQMGAETCHGLTIDALYQVGWSTSSCSMVQTAVHVSCKLLCSCDSMSHPSKPMYGAYVLSAVQTPQSRSSTGAKMHGGQQMDSTVHAA